MHSANAQLEILRSALASPATVDAWPVDAPQLVDGGWSEIVAAAVRLRATGQLNVATLCLELEAQKRWDESQALRSMSLDADPLSGAEVRGAWKTIRAARGYQGASAAVRPPRAMLRDEHDAEDMLNARRLAERARGLFINALGPYHHWDGRRWEHDDAQRIYELAADVARSWYRDAADAATEQEQKALVKHAIQSQRAPRIEAMISLAWRALPDLKVDPKALNRDPYVLNVKNGTLHLRTGELRPHDPADLITKLAPVEYDPTAEAPRFKRFLEEVLPSPEVRAYVQRAAGWSLTGNIEDHVFFMLVGSGRNGKGVLMRLLLHAMGDYATTAPPSMLIARKNDEHPTELLCLEGARFVYASELPPGRRWDEQRMKQFTGGDPVDVRGMRENFRRVMPTWKIWIATNDRPHVAGGTDSFWARLKEIRFPVQFRDLDDPRPERASWPLKNPRLEEELMQELPGILRWAVDGCIQWHERGLGEPPEVRAATAEYQADEDHLQPFLEANPVIQPVKLRELFERWKGYAEGVNERPGSQPEFSKALGRKGYPVRKGTGGVYYVQPIPVQLQAPEITELVEWSGVQRGFYACARAHTRDNSEFAPLHSTTPLDDPNGLPPPFRVMDDDGECGSDGGSP